ncbi:MAG TPA: hypothetical protein VMH41_16960 [Mycobacteriales bacterium]|nr:hypothetical protein [Mycobacteriales bacterium]
MNAVRSIELTEPMRRVEGRLGRPLRDFLEEQYATRTLADIATELGVSEVSVMRWMARLGIERRFPGQRPAAVA